MSWSSTHGSPGVTSFSLLAAAAWPRSAGVERVMLEADADGGVLAARYGLGVDPGVATLVAGVRRHPVRDRSFDVSTSARHLDDQVWVIPSPESAERVGQVWADAVDDVAEVAARDDRVWLVDCGRLSSGSVGWSFATRAAMSVVVCGPRQEDLLGVPARVGALQRGGGVAGVLVVGRVQYGVDELREFFGTDAVWRVRATADLTELAYGVLTSRRARRSWVWREALDVATDLAARLGGSSAVVEPKVDQRASLGEAAGE